MGVMRVVLNDSGRQRDAWIILDGGKKNQKFFRMVGGGMECWSRGKENLMGLVLRASLGQPVFGGCPVKPCCYGHRPCPVR